MLALKATVSASAELVPNDAASANPINPPAMLMLRICSSRLLETSWQPRLGRAFPGFGSLP
jgi:hypothetical protein